MKENIDAIKNIKCTVETFAMEVDNRDNNSGY